MFVKLRCSRHCSDGDGDGYGALISGASLHDRARECRISNMNSQALLFRRLSSAMAVPSGGSRSLVWSSSSVRIGEVGGRIGGVSWSRVGTVRGARGVHASAGRELEENGGVAAISGGRGSEYLPPRFR